MTEGSDRVPEAIVTAAEHQRAGQLRQAERIYKRILKGQPDNADALHLLGVLSHQVGKNDVAVALIGKAIQSNPTKAFFFTNLATVLHMQGKLEEAPGESLRRWSPRRGRLATSVSPRLVSGRSSPPRRGTILSSITPTGAGRGSIWTSIGTIGRSPTSVPQMTPTPAGCELS